MRLALAASPGVFISSVSICVSTERVILSRDINGGRGFGIRATKAEQFREDMLPGGTRAHTGDRNKSTPVEVTLYTHS